MNDGVGEPHQSVFGSKDFTFKIHPEKAVDGFSALDGTVRFYGFVQAILLRTRARAILDYGAGRGAAFHDDISEYRRHLMDLRAFGAKVTACDIDRVVLEHPASDWQVLIKPGVRLPFDDGQFDVIVSDMTFEHIEDAKFVASELSRVLRPGGFICARTPNKHGYVKLFSAIIPNRFHVQFLRRIQPTRKPEDVFPTVYKMNDARAIRSLFRGHDIHHYYDSSEPAYYFGSRLIYIALLFTHKIIPKTLGTSICYFVHKPAI